MDGMDAYWVRRHLDELRELFASDRAAKYLGSRRRNNGCKLYVALVEGIEKDMDWWFRDDPEYRKDDGLVAKARRDFIDAAMCRLESARECLRRSYDPRLERDRRLSWSLDDLYGRLLSAEDVTRYRERVGAEEAGA